MRRNEDLPVSVVKADLAIADLAAKGYLVAEQMKKFLKVAILKSKFMQYVRVTTMSNPTQEIAKMTTLGQVMHPAVESEALTVSQRSKVGFDAVTLTSYIGKAEIHWPRRLLEDQIERGNISNSMLEYMGGHVSADLDDLLIQGDTTSTNDWLAVTNGIITSSASNVYPAGSATLSKAILDNLIQTLPEQFEDAYDDAAFYTNRKARADYLSSLGDRATLVGDTIIEGKFGKELGYQGIPLRRIPRWPGTMAPGGVSTVVWYGGAKNNIMAFQRKTTIDREFRISPQVYVVVMTLRVAIGQEHEPACAKATQVTGS